ncbi:MAG: amidohydrolase, partial [Defluviitaleaceae bacterium]|nr:amidohydrolase [Defluviitaleaceae bacterium]
MLCIKNGTLHTIVDPKPFVGDILVNGDKIVKIGRNLSAEAGEIIDATGMQVYPGLVDCHSHLGLSGHAVRFEGQDYNEYTDSITPQLQAIDAFNPQDEQVRMAALGGVTTVGTGPGSSNVLGGTFIAVKTAGTRVDDMIILRKAAMKCAFGENPKFCYRDKDNSSRMSVASKLRNVLNKTKEYMAKREAAEAAGEVLKRPPYDEKLEAMIQVIKGEIPLKAHAHRADD